MFFLKLLSHSQETPEVGIPDVFIQEKEKHSLIESWATKRAKILGKALL